MRDSRFHEEKVLNTVFEQRNLLYELHCIDDTLLDTKDKQIVSLKADLQRVSRKYELSEEKADNNLKKANMFEKAYLHEKRVKNGVIIGGCVVVGGSVALVLYNSFRR